MGVSGVVCCRPGTLKSASEPLFSPDVDAIPDDMSELIVLSWQTLPPWDWPVCPVARVESRSMLSILENLTKILLGVKDCSCLLARRPSQFSLGTQHVAGSNGIAQKRLRV